jgi:polysaccharide pyruvyl transferase WcaK-like protein
MQRIKENFGQKTNFIPDLAFYHEYNQNKNNSSSRLIVGIITYEIYKSYFYEVNSPDQKILQQNEYISAWLQKILSLKDKFNEIELISTTSEDIVFSKMLFEELKIFAPNIKVTFIDYVMNLEAYLERLSDSKIMLSARMHSLILAQVNQCEVIPWVISDKIHSYKNEYLHKDTSIIAREIKNILDIALERLDK